MNESKTATSFGIRAPLMAFERVFRRTGMIRKTCTFHNPGDQPMEVEVRHGFREHSWLQVMVEGSEDVDGERLVLEPGDTRVHVLMNTDSSNFPYDRFRGRVYFQETDGDSKTAQWIEISFEEIEGLRDFDGYAAIDLGTSNSVVALYHLQEDALDGAPWNPLLEGGGAEVPSAVFIRDLGQFRKLAEGSCSVGHSALEEYRRGSAYDPRSLQLGVKRMIGADRILGVDAHGAGGYVDPLEVLQMLARVIRERSQNDSRVRSRIRKLMVTFPPTWDYRQIDRWKEMFRRLGFKDEDLDLSLDEASAAGLFHVFRWMKDPDERNRLLQDLMSADDRGDANARDEHYVLRLLSFDFGGGTIDLALIAVQLTVRGDVIRVQVALEGSDSLAFGGDQVTLAVFRILKRRLAMALSDPQRAAGRPVEQEAAQVEAEEASLQSGRYLLPAKRAPARFQAASSAEDAAREIAGRWAELERHIADARLPDGLDNPVDAVLCTRFWRSDEEPIRPAAKHNFGWLWDRAESLKRQLFRMANRRGRGLSLTDTHEHEIRGGIALRDLPGEMIGRHIRQADLEGTAASVSVGEIYRAISEPLRTAVASARRLAGEAKVDRIVLTGQSSWIPLIRRLFMRPRSEGGFGLAPNKIEFDEENAKAAVSKGACLLRVLREALVGIDVDVSRFRANQLTDVFYRSTVEGPRLLFTAGPIDDLRYTEESPDPASFPRHLSVFSGSPPRSMGRFDFEDGVDLPAFDPPAAEAAAKLDLANGFPRHVDFLRLQPEEQRAIRNAVDDWPETVRIAWMEASATPGAADRPVYRYYLTRNRNLLAVRDRGLDKKLFRLRADHRSPTPVSPEENPFSGIH